jgi:DNA polymerase-1
MELELIVDIETDGLLPDVTKIHCIGMTVVGALAAQIFANEEPYECIEDALELMSRAKSLTGHNIIGYDLPVLKKLLGWTPSKNTEIIDTLVMSRLCHTSLREVDAKQKSIETKFWGSHSLKAWGKRLGVEKAELAGDDVWSHFTEDMGEYCMQDVLVTSELKYHFELQEYSPEAIQLEHQFATVIQRQVEYGFSFDIKKGQELYVKLLKRQDELGGGLRKAFGSWFVSDGELTPKKDNLKRGYTAGAPLTKIKKIEFNPNSRDHIARNLKTFGWVPKDFTPNGKPKIDETVLSKLDLPHCKELKEHFLISKRISQLAEGDNAWLKLERNGRIYGGVNTNGAVTGRCTHSRPNVLMVLSVGLFLEVVKIGFLLAVMLMVWSFGL